MCLCVCLLRKGTTFRIQKILPFLQIIASFRTQRNWLFLTFIATFRTQRNCLFPCFLTLLYSKNFVFSYVIQKCPEREKRQNPLKYSKNLVNSPVSRHCLLGKVRRLEGRKVGRLEGWNVGRLEDLKVQVMKGFCCFPKS